MKIATQADLVAYLANDATKAEALAYLQLLMDEEYQYGSDGTWGIVSPSGLSRLGLTRTAAVALGATDTVIAEPTRTDDVASAQTAAYAAINAKAETLRGTVMTLGSGQATTYALKLAEAVALLADADPTEEEYPLIYAEVGITAATASEVAMAVQTAAETVNTFLKSVEKVRMAGKKAVAAATTSTEVATALAAISWPSAS